MNKYWFDYNPPLTYFYKILMLLSHHNRKVIKELYYLETCSTSEVMDSDYIQILSDIEYSSNKINYVERIISRLSIDDQIKFYKKMNEDIISLYENVRKNKIYDRLDKSIKNIFETLLTESRDNDVMLKKICFDYSSVEMMRLFRPFIYMLWIREMNEDTRLGHHNLYNTIGLMFGDNGLLN